MNSIEIPANSGLVAMRQMFSPELAGTFQAEMVSILGFWEAKNYVDGKTDYQQHRRIGLFLNDRANYPATHEILTTLGIKESPDTWLTANYYGPKTAQNFHQDNDEIECGPFIIHGTGEGAFDYSLTATSSDEAGVDPEVRSINFSAGDVMYQGRLDQWHRGRNATTNPRVTVAIAAYKPREEIIQLRQLRLQSSSERTGLI